MKAPYASGLTPAGVIIRAEHTRFEDEYACWERKMTPAERTALMEKFRRPRAVDNTLAPV